MLGDISLNIIFIFCCFFFLTLSSRFLFFFYHYCIVKDNFNSFFDNIS